ncbi:hypothetical protein DCAR_0415585 [Daucus carota subsp. sativus]|uniref:Uncharacterized protein n=1 Tax=Daucus carota subsp. sativus TaxID=79200 RepID=A0A165WH28_DAUCS|nr:hypothetical protein DCAR_0415585 [Daucus carota subsp. sativus]
MPVVNAGSSNDNMAAVSILNAKALQQGWNNNLKNFESSGLTISDLKRHRLDRPNEVDQVDNQGLGDQHMMDSQKQIQNQKNLLMGALFHRPADHYDYFKLEQPGSWVSLEGSVPQ